MKGDTMKKITLVAICAIFILVLTALILGYNGALLASGIGIIAYLAGLATPKKSKPEK